MSLRAPACHSKAKQSRSDLLRLPRANALAMAHLFLKKKGSKKGNNSKLIERELFLELW